MVFEKDTQRALFCWEIAVGEGFAKVGDFSTIFLKNGGKWGNEDKQLSLKCEKMGKNMRSVGGGSFGRECKLIEEL